jgi:hypothetical protein
MSPMRATCPSHLPVLDLITLIVYSDDKLWISSFFSLLQLPATPSLLGSDFLLSHTPCSSLWARSRYRDCWCISSGLNSSKFNFSTVYTQPRSFEVHISGFFMFAGLNTKQHHAILASYEQEALTKSSNSCWQHWYRLNSSRDTIT